MGTDADEVSHVNGWVSLVSEIKLGLAYLIDLPEKMQAKTGKGKEKRQFLTEKASDTESLGLFRGNMAHCKRHTEASGGSGVLETAWVAGSIFFHRERKGRAS